MSKAILNRDYISEATCERFAEVCRLRYKRLMDIQEQLLFESLEKLCKQAAKYAEQEEQRDDSPCPECGKIPAFDGMWHKAGCSAVTVSGEAHE